MTDDATPNPFASPREAAPAAPPQASGALVAFTIRSALKLVVLPGGVLAASMVASPTLSPWSWPAIYAGAAAPWLPSLIVQLQTRFLRVSKDDRPILLTAAGEWMDREAFLWWVRSHVWDGLLAMFSMAAILMLLAPELHVVVTVLGIGLYLVFVAWWCFIQWCTLLYADALVLHAGRKNLEALERLARVDRLGFLARPVLGSSRLLGARCWLHLGEPARALAALATVEGQALRPTADLLEAQIQVEQDETLAEALLAGPKPESWAHELGWDTLVGLLAATRGLAPDSWPDPRLMVGSPTTVRQQFDLIRAAQLAQVGRHDEARALLAPLDRAEHAWIAACWPSIWAVILPLWPPGRP